MLMVIQNIKYNTFLISSLILVKFAPKYLLSKAGYLKIYIAFSEHFPLKETTVTKKFAPFCKGVFSTRKEIALGENSFLTDHFFSDR